MAYSFNQGGNIGIGLISVSDALLLDDESLIVYLLEVYTSMSSVLLLSSRARSYGASSGLFGSSYLEE